MRYENKCIDCKLISEGGNRYPGCQDHCEHYIKLKEYREGVKAARHNDMEQKTVKYESLHNINRSSTRRIKWKCSKKQ